MDTALASVGTPHLTAPMTALGLRKLADQPASILCRLNAGLCSLPTKCPHLLVWSSPLPVDPKTSQSQ